MIDYAIPSDHPSLFPDTGYGLVVMDTWKAPDSDDFINMIQQWEEKEQVSFPPPKSGYNYYIYTCEGETYDRDAWQNRE